MLRTARGLSQLDLANLVGVSLRTVGTWEKTGRIPPERLPSIKEALGEDVDSDGQSPPSRPEPIEVVYQGMRFVIHPRPGATPAEVRTQSREIIDAVLQRLEQLDAEAAARED